MSTPAPDAVASVPVRRWLVAGALLSLTGSTDDATGGGVRDALLMAVLLTQRAGATAPAAVVDGVLSVLGNLGWVASDVSSTSTPAPAREVPAEQLPASAAAALAPARRLPSRAAAAWSRFVAAPGSRAALVVDGVSGTAPGAVLTLLHVDLTPAVPTAGFPWARATAPGTLTRHTATLTPDATVWTASTRSTLATKVSGAVATEVVDL